MNHKNMLCPYRTKSIVYHNDLNNVYLPDVGINRRITHDIIDVTFKACIKDRCMMYNSKNNSCNIKNK